MAEMSINDECDSGKYHRFDEWFQDESGTGIQWKKKNNEREKRSGIVYKTQGERKEKQKKNV